MPSGFLFPESPQKVGWPALLAESRWLRLHHDELDNWTCIISSMSKPRRKTSSLPPDDTLYHIKHRKPVLHEFVLDAISALLPHTRPICLASTLETRLS